jgi:hypothetical protein
VADRSPRLGRTCASLHGSRVTGSNLPTCSQRSTQPSHVELGTTPKYATDATSPVHCVQAGALRMGAWKRASGHDSLAAVLTLFRWFSSAERS